MAQTETAIDLAVTVLTQTHWPLSLAVAPCQLPTVLTTAFDAFKAFYLKRHSGRKLTYSPHLGTVDLRANYPKRRHELSVPTAMASVLLRFNEQDSYTFQVQTLGRSRRGRRRRG